MIDLCKMNGMDSLKLEKQVISGESKPSGLWKNPESAYLLEFCKPVSFKYGASFKSKSEEARFEKISSQILKLRQLLVNDPLLSHEYIFKFLRHFFSIKEIGHFSDEGLRNFIHTIIQFRKIDPNQSVKEFVLSAMKNRHREEGQIHQIIEQEKIDQIKALSQNLTQEAKRLNIKNQSRVQI
mmetsp:Transcript_19935/g.18941  ORF Transcript_19935/g.18941 Transcript_19935/m.18941 type:complete len:182 (-) Transcript_19935:539-1084(-)